MKLWRFFFTMVSLLLVTTVVRGGETLSLGKRATVLLFVGSHCPCTDPHRLLIQSLVKDYQPKGVAFYTIFSNRGENIELAQRFMRQTGWNFLWKIDSDGSLMKKYQATLTPEAILLSSSGKIIYRGAIDDSVPNLGRVEHPYLKTALTQWLENKPITLPSAFAYGCYIVR